MAIERIFFDLDDTLYPRGNGVWQEISSRITQFMVEKVGLSAEQAEALRLRYYRQFGTSLAGLMVDYQVQAEEYLAYVHAIPLEKYLAPDPTLTELLASLPQDKAVFTNASRSHAQAVLRHLQISEHFDRIIAIEDTGLVNKPELAAYTKALRLTEPSQPERSLFIDDRAENLKPASELGMTTVLISEQHLPAPYIDFQIPTVHSLVKAVPPLRTSVDQTNGSI